MADVNDILLIAGALFNMGFAVFHLLFWRVFRWREELSALGRVNRGIMQILNLCLTLVFLVVAYISLAHRSELLHTPLGHTLLFACSLFWALRLAEQVIFFGARSMRSNAFTCLFLIGSVLYAVPLIRS